MSSVQTHEHLRLVTLTGIDRVSVQVGRLTVPWPRRARLMTAMRRTVRHGVKKLGLVLASCLFALTLSEAALHVCGFSYPVFTQRDPDRGFAYRPEMSFINSDEGFAHVEINRHGFRDADRAVAKPENTVRVAVLGDSYTAAVQVEQHQRFTEVLQRELQQMGVFGNKHVEVLNFGMSGYGTAQELMTLRQQVWKFQPDIVMLAFLSGNDIRNNCEVLEKDPSRPYFVYDGDNLAFDDSFRNDRSSWTKEISLALANHSRIAQLAYRIRQLAKSWRSERQLNSSSGPQAELCALGLSQPGLDVKIYSEPGDTVWHDAWRVTEGLISQMQREVAAQGAQFLVVTLSNAAQVHPDPSARRRFLELVGASDLFYADTRIKQAAEKDAIPVLNLAPPLQGYAEQKQVYLHGFENTRLGSGHWNSEGHRLAGKLIAEWMAQLNDRRYSTETITVSAQ